MQLTQQEQLICALTGQHGKATILVRIVQVLGHLSYSLGQYKEALTKFAEQLNEPGYDRTPTVMRQCSDSSSKVSQLCRWITRPG